METRVVDEKRDEACFVGRTDDIERLRYSWGSRRLDGEERYCLGKRILAFGQLLRPVEGKGIEGNSRWYKTQEQNQYRSSLAALSCLLPGSRSLREPYLGEWCSGNS